MTGAIVIGIGNPYRHDDGVGLAVIEAVAAAAPPATEVVEELGEAAALVERWTGRELAIVVDAAASGAAAGTIHHFECGRGASAARNAVQDAAGDSAGGWPGPSPRSRSSSHALGVDDAVELGRTLGRLPGRLIVVGIEAADMSAGVGMSPPVLRAIQPAVRIILAALAGPVRLFHGDTGVVH